MAFWCNGKNGVCREYERCGKVNCGVYDGTGGHRIETNADRIRAMSNEELATDLLAMVEEICEDGIPSKEWMMMWLQQPAEGVE